MLALMLAACEAAVPPAPPPAITVSKIRFDELPGWQTGRPDQALTAWRRSCARILAMDAAAPLGGQVGAGTAGDWRAVCTAVIDFDGGAGELRRFVEANFVAYAVTAGDSPQGLFTGYFEPIVRAVKHKGGAYTVPIHGLPADHVTVDLKDFDPDLAGRSLVGRVEDGRLRPYPDRAAIAGNGEAAPNQVLYWADDALDVFILQVQGSGLVELPDGSRRRIGFAGHNGYDYTSVGRWLIAQNELRTAGWQDIRSWMAQNPDRVADLLALNRRYIFFRDIDGDGAQGAAGVALSAGRSLAVDPAFVPLNVPLWLDTVHPGPGEGPLRRLVLAQDVGNAIRGPVRGDLFWGVGPEALARAGRMNSPGRYYVLLPAGVGPP